MKFASQKKSKQRRGVLLIVVLSLLVLFALIGLTFVVVAGQYKQAASITVLHDQTDEQGPELVEQALYDVLRSTTNPKHALFNVNPADPNVTLCHSILEDLYGRHSFRATVDSVDDTSFPGFLLIDFSTPTPAANFVDRTDYYSGQVLSMLTGNCALLSTRIVRFNHATDTFLVEAFEHEAGVPVKPAQNDILLVNGRPFSGIAGDPAAGIYGETNEDYDAPDRNNPHLAFIPSGATQPTNIIGSYIDRAYPVFAIDANNDGRPDLRVDNDGDGIFDSVWLDFDMPVKTAPNGQRYKPFVAVLCVDLDGRANLNAHGSLAQVHANYTTAASDFWANASNNGFYSAPGQNTQNIRPRGNGAGPAEVNISTIVGSSNYQAFLQERYKSQYIGDLFAGINGSDPLNLLENQGVPNDFTTAPGGYGSWFDLLGQGMVGLDMRGQPLHKYMGAGQMFNPPYESNLVDPDGTDSPYTYGDLERILRWRDVDTKSLSRRLETVAPALIGTPQARRSVTTASFHIPVPAVPQHIIDRFTQRLVENGGTYDDAVIRKMIPFELLHGGKMNINRFWGNGLDNNTNAIVDEITELTAVETIMADVYGGTAPNANYINDMDAGLVAAQGRHLFARNLYCLMMFLMDKDPNNPARIAYRIPLTGAPFGAVETLTDDQHYELTVRRIAQWCINVVDFRDPDAIMTPFEYDINPFDGWNVDGLVDDGSGSISADDGNATRRLVWGCEYPDVLMTESLAFHDRRVRDTEWDDPNHAVHGDKANEDDHPDFATTGQGTKRIHPMDPGDNTMPGDKDLDQVRIPQGSLFLEFHCMRNRATNHPVFPRELYTAAGQLDMARKDAQSGIFPVWRVAISASHHSGSPNSALSFQARRAAQPDSTTFDPAKLSHINITDALPIERFMWFTNTAPVAGTHQELPGNTYFNQANRSAQIAPGEYLVVGPRQQTFIGSKPTSTAMNPDPVVTTDADQRIDLDSGGATIIDYTDLDGNSAYPLGPNAGPSQIAAPKTIYAVADAPGYPGGVSGLNITEPLPTAANKYPDPTHDRNGVMDAYGNGTTAAYLDKPLDGRDNRPLSAAVDDKLDTQTVLNYKTAILQRLANPLLAHHPVTNPYLTVDWIPLDVTIFNGEDREPDTWDQGVYGDFDPDDDAPQTPKLGSRERSSDNFSHLIWTPATPAAFGGLQQPTDSTQNAAADECFQYDLEQAAPGRDAYSNCTLGYLNSGFHGNPFLPPIPGPLNNPAGDPPTAHPWLAWLNRPFANRYELLMVPFAGPAELLHRLSALNFDNPVDPTFELRMPFAHLLNFYHAGSTSGVTPPHFYRLLEYVETPSRFIGTSRWYAHDAAPLATYGPPFHRLSRFRDPGLMNANTVPGPEAWTCVAENTFTSWANLLASRRDPPLGGPTDSLGRFNNPFRSGWRTTTASHADRTMLRYSQAAFAPLMANRPFAFDKHFDHNVNPFFYFQGLTRQAAMLTTQSNVYAVWITVGYFEVNENGAPTGAELGQDTGEIKRHRGFFIIDRSIPVAYERGRNHNVDKAIRLRRYIE